ncbi:MAG: TetR family transcriptional regulator [Ilumatobacteraceae bacterium]|nr:TetR family transcriptional regulator [Ilumatobacteraceae bacterium]
MTATILPIRRGRPRSETADHAILAATLEVLAAEGYAGLTMASVIVKAGTSSATLYRRWPTKLHLVAAALASLDSAVTHVDTGSLDGDITAFVDSLAAAYATPRDEISEEIALELGRNLEFRAVVNEKFRTPRIAVLDSILRRARERGEIGDGVSSKVGYSFVSGPMHHRFHVLNEPITPAFGRVVAVGALAALRAIAPPG